MVGALLLPVFLMFGFAAGWGLGALIYRYDDRKVAFKRRK